MRCFEKTERIPQLMEKNETTVHGNYALGESTLADWSQELEEQDEMNLGAPEHPAEIFDIEALERRIAEIEHRFSQLTVETDFLKLETALLKRLAAQLRSQSQSAFNP